MLRIKKCKNNLFEKYSELKFKCKRNLKINAKRA